MLYLYNKTMHNVIIKINVIVNSLLFNFRMSTTKCICKCNVIVSVKYYCKIDTENISIDQYTL